MDYTPQVLVDRNSRPVLVYNKGRVKYHAVVATEHSITLASFGSIRELKPLERKGEPYPPRKAASFWLNRDHRSLTKRAKAVLRSLVTRKAST